MKLSVRMFGHNSQYKSFSAEASDLGGYFDSDTRRITLVSDFNTEADFDFRRCVRSDDIDNEIQCWEYLPTAESVAANPRLKDYTLTVFND